VCAEHSHVVPAEGFRATDDVRRARADDRRAAAKTLALSTEIDGTGSTAKALQEKLEELTLADRRKDEFLAMLGHELRNPLSPILSALQILQLPGADAAANGMARETIAHQTRHLARIVDDLLDVTRISTGKIELRNELVDLASVIRRAIGRDPEPRRVEAPQVSLALPPETFSSAATARGSSRCSSTCSRTPRSTWPRMAASRSGRSCAAPMSTSRSRTTAWASARRSAPVVRSVHAGGTLARSLARGLGIGLWMVRKLVELHHGSVDAHSDGPGKGSRFVVTLPVAQSSGSNAERSSCRRRTPRRARRRAPHPRGRRQSRRCGQSRAALPDVGPRGRRRYDGVAALELASTFHPDVVLLDIGLPGRDGYDVARALRRSYTRPAAHRRDDGVRTRRGSAAVARCGVRPAPRQADRADRAVRPAVAADSTR
jgi:hypothetical protein